MSETKPVCNRDAAVPYEQADTATCPHCGHTAREHWAARTEENVAQWERQAALSAARDEVVRAAQAWAGSVDSADRRLCEMRLGNAVAALAKLEPK